MDFLNVLDTSLFEHAFMEMMGSCISVKVTWMFHLFINLYVSEMDFAHLLGLFSTSGFNPIDNM